MFPYPSPLKSHIDCIWEVTELETSLNDSQVCGVANAKWPLERRVVPLAKKPTQNGKGAIINKKME